MTTRIDGAKRGRSLGLAVLTWVVLGAAPVAAQGWAVAAGVDVGMSRRAELETLQSQLARLLARDGIEAEVLATFPDRPGWGVQATHRIFGNARLGLAAGFTQTGARLYYGDQAGDVQLDQELSRLRLGPVYEQPVVGAFRVAGLWGLPLFRAQVAYERTALVHREHLRIGEAVLAGERRFRAHQVGAGFGLALQLSRGPLFVRLGAGYRFVLPVPFEAAWGARAYYLEDGSELLVLPGGTKVRAEGGGPEATLQVGIDLNLR